MKINYQKGFVVPLVIAIVILLIAGGVYFATKVKSPVIPSGPGSYPNPAMVGQDGPRSDIETYGYDIPELGVKFVLPATISDLTYTVYHLEGDQAVNSVAFSSKKLAAMGCATGTLGYLTYDSDKGGSLVAKARGSNLYYIKPSFVCGSSISTEAVSTLNNALKYLVTDYLPATTTNKIPIEQKLCPSGATNYPHCNADLPFPDSDWKTYINSQYGFQIQYPSDFALVSNMTPAQQRSVMSYMGTCNNDLIICYTGNQTTDGFVVAGVDISPSTSTNMIDCDKTQQNNNGQLTTQTIIAGQTLYEDMLGNAGLGHYVSMDSYRTYENGVCYTISLDTESAVGGTKTGWNGLDPVFIAMMNGKLKAILATFRFIGSTTSFTNDGTKTPVITSITPSRVDDTGSVTISGEYLNGFEGMTQVVITNKNQYSSDYGKIGYLEARSNIPAGAIGLQFALPVQICTQPVGESGRTCPSTMAMSPGEYEVYVEPWNIPSNSLMFTIIQ